MRIRKILGTLLPTAALVLTATLPAAASAEAAAGKIGSASASAPDASAAQTCTPGHLCLWVGINRTGTMISRLPSEYAADFRTIFCGDPTCNTGSFNDEASSWWNNGTGIPMCVSRDANGMGEDNTMPNNSYGNFTGGWSDVASSLSNSGCP